MIESEKRRIYRFSGITYSPLSFTPIKLRYLSEEWLSAQYSNTNPDKIKLNPLKNPDLSIALS